ncbi:hypothetical protein BDW62DRAFT_202346 [Aspergillus aurantiobrunneus]
MTYTLSITIAGPGTTERAHWDFTIHKPAAPFGSLLHVRLLDSTNPNKHSFIFENREGHGLSEQDAWGLVPLAQLDGVQRAAVVSVLEKEKPPVGVGRCQDWVVDALVALEVEELVPDGMARAWSARIGRVTVCIREEVGEGWLALNGR